MIATNLAQRRNRSKPVRRIVGAMADARRLIALLCIAFVLLAAAVPGASGLPWAILVPLWFLAAFVAAVSMRREIDAGEPQPCALLSTAASRAPPAGF
jgi:hypothetical protein